jgi:choice-of-anchor A domain-containing protein
MNSPGYAKNFQIYGLPSLTSVSFHGNAGFVGTIYAPEADMTGGGGGNNVQDTSGAMVVKSVTLNGHWNFHYDQSLKTFGPTLGWVATKWSEAKYP